MNIGEIRIKGSPLSSHWFGWFPAEGEDWIRVVVLFRVLMAEEDLDFNIKMADAFSPIAMDWTSTYPQIGPVARKLGRSFILEYFKVDNPSLLPVLLHDWYHQAVLDEASTEAATFRLESLERDSSPLGWPNTRHARDRFTGRQESNRSFGYERKDIGSLWRFAEAWVRVRHGLESSLSDLVSRQPVRGYTKADGEEPDFKNRYTNWRRQLKKFDEALKKQGWAQILK